MCVCAKFRILSSDMLEQRCSIKLTKEELNHEIARALLKRRIMTYLVGKFRGKDEETVDYTPGREPSKVLQIFSTMEAFRSSLLSSHSTASLPWLAKLPNWQLDVLSFLTKMLRSNPTVDEALDVVLQKDLQISPEMALQSEALAKAELLDLQAVLAAKAEAEMAKAPEPVPVPAEEPAAPESPRKVEADEQDESQLVIPSTEQGESDMPSAPVAPCRQRHFGLLAIPEVVRDVLHKRPVEYYEEAVEWAKMRVRSFLNVRLKTSGGWEEMRAEVKGACENFGSTMFVYDTKLRLRNATDGILFQPFKRPVPLSLANFKKFVHALWSDPQEACLDRIFLDLGEGSGFGVGGTLSRQPPEPVFTEKDTPDPRRTLRRW